MRQSIDFDSTQARQIMVSEVNHEVGQMRSAMHSEYQAAVFSEKRELYSEFHDRLNQEEMTVDAMQAERQMVQVERRAMQASQQRLGGEQSDELHKLRPEWTVYQNTEVREFGELRRTAINNYVEFHTCQEGLHNARRGKQNASQNSWKPELLLPIQTTGHSQSTRKSKLGSGGDSKRR